MPKPPIVERLTFMLDETVQEWRDEKYTWHRTDGPAVVVNKLDGGAYMLWFEHGCALGRVVKEDLQN